MLILFPLRVQRISLARAEAQLRTFGATVDLGSAKWSPVVEDKPRSLA